MKKQKVLIVYQFIALYRKPIFEYLSKNKDIDFSFACDIHSKENILLVDEEFFHNKSFIRLKNFWFKNFLWQTGLIKEVMFGQYDTIVFLADPNFISTWIATIFTKIRDIKVVFWTHGFIRDNTLRSKMKLFFFKLSDSIFLYGDKAKKNLSLKGLDSNNLFPIYNSLDYSLQKKTRMSIDPSQLDKSFMFENPKLPQIVFIGRLTEQKKLQQLIELIHALEKNNLKVNLLFIGDGEERTVLEEIAFRKYSLQDRVYFYGKTYNEEEIAPLIMGSDVCISPGEIGLTAMHVLAYGVPIITHNDEFSQMPEYEAVIDGKTGKLFEKNSFDSMLKVSIDFFNNPINDIYNNCINIIEQKYTPKNQMELIINALILINEDKK